MNRRAMLQVGAAVGATAVLGPVPAEAGGKGPRIYRPGDAGYAAEIASYDVSQVPEPGLVVAATSAADVRAAVRLAARRNAPVAVLATGHQWAVPIQRDAVLVSTRHMTGVHIDAERRVARVPAGTLWQQVVDESVKVGLAPINGSTGGVSVVGYTLGGGLSPMLGRRYGYAADHVRGIDVVTADGRLRTVTAASDPELFFGLRGGKSNFGVATAIEFDLFPVASYYGGVIYFAGRDAGRLLHAYRRWVATVPDAMSSSVAITRMPDRPEVPAPLRGQTVAGLRICFLGRTETGAALVKPLRSVAPAILDAVTESPYASFNAIHGDPVDPAPAYERTALLRELPADAVDALLSVAGPDAPFPVTMVEIRHLGGALSRPPRAANAVSNRGAAFTLFTVGITPPAGAAPVRKAQSDLIRRMGRWTTGGLYVNFMSPDDSSPDSVRRAYQPEVYQRLRKLKRQVDPHNMFRLNQNIPPL
jgi:hypothetical protein